MSGCSQDTRLQDLLDGTLSEAEAIDLRRHAAACAECTRELALFERVFGSLERLPLETPRAELMERVLTRVLPSRRRRHRVAAIGWGYAGCVAAFAAVVGVVAANPPARAFIELAAGTVSHRVVELLSFVTYLAGMAVLGVAGGLEAMVAAGERVAPIGRALQAVLTMPSFAAALLTAFTVCAALLWWLRPTPSRRRRSGPTDVGVLGFWGLA